MPTNAAHISPYLTDAVSHHEQLTLVPAENAGRIRRKNAHGDLETVTAPAGRRRKERADAAVATNRPGAYKAARTDWQQADRLRSPNRPRSAYSNALNIPDEPPPTFEEAMSSPSYSIGPSAALDPPIHRPLASRLRHETPALLDDTPAPVTNESTESLQLIGRDEGTEPEPSQIRGRIDRIQAESSKHRRHLSLSPLKTLATLSSRQRRNIETMSQPGSPGSVTSVSSMAPFSKSANSLMIPTSSTNAPGFSRTGTGLSRKLFSSKSKARETPSEPEDDSDWLVVDRETEQIDPPPRPTSAASNMTFQTASSSSLLESPEAPILTPVEATEEENEEDADSAPATPTGHEGSMHDDRSSHTQLTSALITDSSIHRPASPSSTLSWYSQPDYVPTSPSESFCTAISERSISEATIRDSDSIRSNSTATYNSSHYPGRPLPRPPVPSTHRSLYDSIYAGPAEESRAPSPPCPEGLLIDFEEPDRDSVYSQDTLHATIPNAQATLETYSRSSYASSNSSYTTAAGTSVRYSDVTDLDVFASRFTDEDSRRGSDYESMLMLQDFLGPAQSTRSNQSAASTRPSSMAVFGQVTVERRRVTKDGRVKLKLTMRDVAVDKCGICLVQFRAKDRASMSSRCRHVFHESCLGRWLRTNTSKTCPTCREPIEAP